MFKNCALFTNCISEINNTQGDNAEDIDIVMPMYNLVEYNNNYSQTSRSLWQQCKNIPAVNNNNDIVNFNEANATNLFKSKAKITGQTDDDGEIDNVKTMVLLKYLRNFWRTPQTSLISSEVNLILTWSANCVIVSTKMLRYYIYNNWNKTLCSSGYFINSR